MKHRHDCAESIAEESSPPERLTRGGIIINWNENPIDRIIARTRDNEYRHCRFANDILRRCSDGAITTSALTTSTDNQKVSASFNCDIGERAGRIALACLESNALRPERFSKLAQLFCTSLQSSISVTIAQADDVSKDQLDTTLKVLCRPPRRFRRSGRKVYSDNCSLQMHIGLGCAGIPYQNTFLQF
jgi:hypothetical protein